MIQNRSQNEITKATDNIYRHIIKDYNIRNRIGSGDGTNQMPKDLTNAIFYQESFHGCKWIETDLTNIGGNGTIFAQNDFIKAKLDNVSLQYCSFSNNIFKQCHMHGSNFANGTFSDSAIVDGDIFGCSFVGTMFNCGIIRNTPIESSTFERCVFKNINFENLDLRQLTLNYSTFDDVTMKNVCLPFIQLPYTFNGLQYVYDTTDDIYIASHEKPGEKLSVAQYMSLLPDFITFFDSQDQHFPLTNCYIVNNQIELAEQSNEIGIMASASRHDFRSLYFYCIQASKILKLSHKKRSNIYSQINTLVKGQVMTDAEYHQFCIYYPMIKRLLFDTPNENPILTLTLWTNIEPDDYERLSVLIAALEEVTGKFEKNLDSKHIEIRHNSPNVFDLFLSGNPQLLIDSMQGIFDTLNPIIANLAAYITVGDAMMKGGVRLNARIKNHNKKQNNDNHLVSKEIPPLADTDDIRNELENLHTKKAEKLLQMYSRNSANSSVPSEKLMNLQKKLQEYDIIIRDVEIQYLDGEGDLMSSLYQQSNNTVV